MAARRPAAWPAWWAFVLNVRIALRAVAAVCVDDLQGVESFTTPFRSASESSALESYDIFRDLAQLRVARLGVASRNAVRIHEYFGLDFIW